MLKYTVLLFLSIWSFSEASVRSKRALSVDMTTFRTQNLDCHNKYRTKHQVGPLVQNSTLDTYAQNYAQYLATNDLFQHSNGPYGENLYGSTGTVDGSTACNKWYAENTKYDYTLSNPPNFSEVGHFTQLVWKGTNQIGIGAATSKTGWTYVVASYNPPGNFQNEYKANVFPPV